MRSLVTDDRDYDWEGRRRTEYSAVGFGALSAARAGFHALSKLRCTWPGTFAGLIEKLPHLKDLGITAFELMPVFDFDEVTVKRLSPVTGLPLTNFWATIRSHSLHRKRATAFRPMPRHTCGSSVTS